MTTDISKGRGVSEDAKREYKQCCAGIGDDEPAHALLRPSASRQMPKETVWKNGKSFIQAGGSKFRERAVSHNPEKSYPTLWPQRSG